MIFHKVHALKTRDGAALVEFAFVVPILALILIIIIDGGLAIWEHQLLQNAAREGARFASLPPGASVAATQQRVLDYCAQEGITVNAADVAVDPAYPIPLGGGLTVRGTEVRVSYVRGMLLLGRPLLPSNNITLTGRSVFRNLYN